MFVGYFAGKLRGEIKQQDLWRNHMEKCSRYMRAVDDLDKWCGHSSPHVRLIARHIKAHGEGEGCNSGTPVGDEPCTISGLREQLKRLSQEARVPLDPKVVGDLWLKSQGVCLTFCRLLEAEHGITAAQKETP